MRKFFFFLLLLLSASFAQEFSSVLASKDTYLNFTENPKEALPIYIDESTSLAWQNSDKLPLFKTLHEAKSYCKHLEIGEFQWVLPTVYELKGLASRNVMVFGHKLTFAASDHPIWDNTLALAYNAQTKKKLYLKSNEQELFVRCVSRLEE